MVRIAIVEDDRDSAERLEKCLVRYGREHSVSFQISHFAEGEAFCLQYKSDFDLIFMDVCMPKMDGFAIAQKIRSVDHTVVLLFLTNMAQYAIKGYEVDALDYMVKPLSYEVLCLKLDKSLRALARRQKKSLVIANRDKVQRIETARIHYIEIYNHQLNYYTEDGVYSRTGATSLKDLEQELIEEGFACCNRCYLVNLQYVDRMEDDYVWVCGQPLKVSRSKKKEFMQALIASYRGKRL